VPTQPDPQGEVEWVELRLQGTGRQEALAARASRKLKGEELLITSLAALRLRYELDRALWVDHEHVGIKQLWEYLATYLYLPRLRDERVLLEAMAKRRGPAYLGARNLRLRRRLGWRAGTLSRARMWAAGPHRAGRPERPSPA
jgi:hypothetical protein